ncbi:MAG: helix-turn-helix transcriptional regulator, partial [Deltaproteobacteria bacterium]|nr:helix-turn-helix transcriptional regulator [Deltaproteobacteria bacterium]
PYIYIYIYIYMEIANLMLFAAAAGLSQSDLARRAGLSRQAISQWLAKGVGFVDVKSSHIKKLALALGISTDDLVMPLPAFGACLPIPN